MSNVIPFRKGGGESPSYSTTRRMVEEALEDVERRLSDGSSTNRAARYQLMIFLRGLLKRIEADERRMV